MFIDASGEFEKVGNQNTLTDTHVEKIIATYEARESIDKYAHVAPISEVVENNYNLNIPRYVDTFEEEEPVDLEVVAEDLIALESEMKETDQTIAGFCEELGIASPFGAKV
jgi:type I restriction enzyme M protein